MSRNLSFTGFSLDPRAAAVAPIASEPGMARVVEICWDLEGYFEGQPDSVSRLVTLIIHISYPPH